MVVGHWSDLVLVSGAGLSLPEPLPAAARRRHRAAASRSAPAPVLVLLRQSARVLSLCAAMQWHLAKSAGKAVSEKSLSARLRTDPLQCDARKSES
jgi:hypothetical protein